MHFGIILILFFLVALWFIIRANRKFKSFAGYDWAEAKGKYGEKIVSETLDLLPCEKYKIINNLVLKTKNGYTQLDHVVVSNYGLFVIETKNYAGWIFGGETKLYWKQVFYQESYSFYNPIYQNMSHIKALQVLMPNLRKFPIISIIVFVGDCELRTQIQNVVELHNLNDTICSYSEQSLKDSEVENIYNRLIELDKSQEYLSVEHKKQVRENSQQTQQKIYTGVCPRCGGILIERKGKFGKFYGCSNYPKCRFTHE